MTATVAPQPSRITVGRVPQWLSVVAVAGLVAALCVWVVVTLSGSTAGSTPAGPAANVHHGSGQYNQLCVPAPSARFC
ncbi:MAG: hypothetical protein QOI15_544 [Pseudonocardiales bacterium]|nr:hypothetical protein [Pseudonocardiales bacterium]